MMMLLMMMVMAMSMIMMRMTRLTRTNPGWAFLPLTEVPAQIPKVRLRTFVPRYWPMVLELQASIGEWES